MMKMMKLSSLLLAVASVLIGVARADDDSVTYIADPNETIACDSLLQTSLPSTFTGASVNTYIGADRFYNAGYTGQNTIIANVEAGLMWGGAGGHETLSYMPSSSFYVAPLADGGYDRHATWVGMMIAGHGGSGYQTGIAPGTDLRSGALATSWSLSPPNWSGSFSTNNYTLTQAYNEFFSTVPADVINSSWGYTDSTGTSYFSVALDGFAAQHPQTTFVVSAGNAGPGTNTVGGPASGYNGISVGALSNNLRNGYNSIASFSSRGAQDYSDPVHGTVSGVRAADDLVAPGDNLTSAYYGGATGGNEGNTADGGPSYYSGGLGGTSFSSPITAAGVALLKSASKGRGLATTSLDTRVIRAVLMNSADKNLSGWNNGQSLIGGVVTTTQSLDWTLGAGRLNLNRAYDQYLSGTTDLSGTAGGSILPLGWDDGRVSAVGAHNDYVFSQRLQGNTVLDVTLSWFRDRTVNVSGLSTTDSAFANLDLEIWNSTFTTLLATSMSQYNSAEELHFTVPADGNYGLRVKYTSQMFGTAGNEDYGLAWSGTSIVPEPGTLVLLAAVAVCLLGLKRWRKTS